MDHCPIVRSYLRGVAGAGNFSSALYENYKENFDDLLQQADTAGGPRARQHQRAFFCIEIMVCRWSWFGTALIAKPFRRSREGLNGVLARLIAEENDMSAENVEFSFSPTKDSQQWWYKVRADRMKLSGLARESIITLRQGLKNAQVSLGPIGTALAEAAAGKRVSIPERLSIARELLEQTEGNATRAWQQASPSR